MPMCAVRGCQNRPLLKIERTRTNYYDPTIKFFSFPKNDKREEWMIATGKKSLNANNARICSIHFAPECFKKKDWIEETYGYVRTKGRMLLADAVPTLHLPDEVYEYLEYRRHVDFEDGAKSPASDCTYEEFSPKGEAISDPEDSEECSAMSSVGREKSQSTQTNENGTDLNVLLAELTEEHRKVKEENERLRLQIKNSISKARATRVLCDVLSSRQMQALLFPDEEDESEINEEKDASIQLS